MYIIKTAISLWLRHEFKVRNMMYLIVMARNLHRLGRWVMNNTTIKLVTTQV